MDGIRASVKKSASDAARKSARQMAHEPLEILGNFDRQLRNVEYTSTEKTQEKSTQEASVNKTAKIDEQKEVEKSKRLSLAYQAELEDIKRQNILKELQRKIINGEDVNLDGIEGLAPDQIQVLKALKEAVLKNRQDVSSNEDSILIEPTSHPKRGLFAGAKTKIERLKRKSETRMSPTG